MKTRLCKDAATLNKIADKLNKDGTTALAMEGALDDAKYLIEGLHGDFTRKCHSTDGDLCHHEECHEVGCIHQKYARIKMAIKAAGN